METYCVNLPSGGGLLFRGDYSCDGGVSRRIGNDTRESRAVVATATATQLANVSSSSEAVTEVVATQAVPAAIAVAIAAVAAHEHGVLSRRRARSLILLVVAKSTGAREPCSERGHDLRHWRASRGRLGHENGVLSNRRPRPLLLLLVAGTS